MKAMVNVLCYKSKTLKNGERPLIDISVGYGNIGVHMQSIAMVDTCILHGIAAHDNHDTGYILTRSRASIITSSGVSIPISVGIPAFTPLS